MSMGSIVSGVDFCCDENRTDSGNDADGKFSATGICVAFSGIAVTQGPENGENSSNIEEEQNS